MKIRISQHLVYFNCFTIVVLFLLTGCSNSSLEIDIKDFGAKGDRRTINTHFIQSAIDVAESKGGGTVHIWEGDFVTGTILLKDNVTLQIHEEATLLGSLYQDDYSEDIATLTDGIGQKFGYALIYAKGVKNVKITGLGVIDGRGFEDSFSSRKNQKRPSLIRIEDSKDITVEGVTLKNSAFWVQHYRNSTDILIDGITVISRSNGNNDGIDIDGCERVKIINSSFDTSDDSIVLKSLSDRVVRDVLVQNNYIKGDKSAFKTGTESVGGFENVQVMDLMIEGTRGINLYSVDGADMKNITVSNITMENSYAVIIMRLGGRLSSFDQSLSSKLEPGSMKDVTISNIKAEGVTANNDFISGMSGYLIEDVVLKDISIEFAESADLNFSNLDIPEKITSYPVNGMFGSLPALGFMVRYAKGIQLDNIRYNINSDQKVPKLFSCINTEEVSVNEIFLNGNEVDISSCIE